MPEADLVSGLNPLDKWAQPPSVPAVGLDPNQFIQPASPAQQLAPGFVRDQSGELTRNGKGPDVMLPGGGPGWREGNTQQGGNARQEAIQFYMSKGLPEHVAVGIVQDMNTRESGMDTSAFNPAGGGMGALGIAQWRGPRQEALLKRPDAYTLKGQLEHSWEELQGPEKATLDRLKTAQTAGEAADIWKTSYERPGPTDQIALDGRRLGSQWAQEDRARYQGDMSSARGMQAEFMRLASAETPGSQKRAELLQKAQESSNRATEAFERLQKTPPIYQPSDIAENFGSAAVLLAVIGGFFAKRPLMASLNAAGAVMQAQNQQKWDQFKVASDQWKTQAEMGLQSARLAHDQIREVMDDERLAENEKQAKLHNLMSGMQMGEQTRWHDMEYQQRIQIAREQALQRADEAKQRWAMHLDTISGNVAEKQKEQKLFEELETARATGDSEKVAQAQQSISDFNSARGKTTISPDKEALRAFLSEHPDATAEEIQAFNQRGHAARSAPGMAVQKFLQENPNATSEDVKKFYGEFLAQSAGQRALVAGKQGDAIRFFSVGIDHLTTFEDYADALENGNIPRINAIRQRIAQETGHEAPTNFDAIKTAVGSEISRAITGSNGALTDREEYRASLNRASSPAQIKGVIQGYKRLMAGQLDGYRRQFQDVKTNEEFDKMLSPIAKRELEEASHERVSGPKGDAAYASPEDVYKAFDAGTLTKEQTKKLLVDKFGYRP